MLRNHRRLPRNWFWAVKRFSSGVVEGFNNKARPTGKVYLLILRIGTLLFGIFFSTKKWNISFISRSASQMGQVLIVPY
uniref:Transposase n=1 Tax=Candidatus Kentrum sp. SD TaxID=2126332 RepID=A0A450Y623_9GAMM|nr:MAG: hypothetical protein BECKSD772F_GA0070984_10085 [Candidatus Kentron sp. SD]VFK42046.1 MAG: hypothetical protein BECKSD772E_GA0070983_101326 [Candidatus Kentron sp. SD]